MAPVTQYTDSDGASIAYQVMGDGPLDLMFLPGWISQVEQIWELPSLRRFFERLGAIGRVIQFDRRGTGLSDRVVGAHSLDQEVRDALAVLDAAGSERAALFTYLLGGLVGALLAAEHPERIGALIMYASVARTAWAPDYDWALTVEQREELVKQNVVAWGEPSNEAIAVLAPSMVGDATLANWLARVQRLAASPGEARQLLASAIDLDVRDALPRIQVPTLVMARTGDRSWDLRHSHYLAQNIPGARYVEMEGVDSFPFIGDSEAILEEVEEFLTGARQHEVTRALRTVLFSDIVDSTARAAQLGDGRWRDLLARHHDDLRKELARFGGHEVKTVGDGVLATFGGPPSSALRCALAISDAATELGVRVRIGMHTGEVELTGDDVAGMAVHIAARVGGLAQPGEVLVSGTVFGTVVGGPFSFEDRGLHELKGVPGRWPLFALGAGAGAGLGG
jgi:class 3 adenylate cyclase/pimeloyl-ACP methyl ester carboxylesterase